MQNLGNLPAEVTISSDLREGGSLGIFFARDLHEYEQNLPAIIDFARTGAIWIAWPKQKSSQRTDLTQNLVRKNGLEAGLVDYKICSIDEIWSALLFTARK